LKRIVPEYSAPLDTIQEPVDRRDIVERVEIAVRK